jgi:ABC-2 type transport system permease protein
MKILAIARANLTRFLRDRSNVFFVFILPIGIVLLIGAQFSGDFTPRIGVVSAGQEFGSELLAGLEDSDAVAPQEYASEDELLLAVERGNVAAGVTVPDDADSALSNGTPIEVGFVTRPDGTGPQLRAVVSDVVGDLALQPSAVAFAVAQGADRAGAETVARAAEQEAVEIGVTTSYAGEALFEGAGQFEIGASSQLVLFMFLTGLTGSAALIQSRQLGVTTRMFGTPTSVGTILAGEALGRFVITLTQGLYIMLATLLLFRVDWGNPFASGAVVIVFAAVGAGAAMLFGTVFRNDQQAGGVSVVAGIGLAALGGSMLPLELFSDSMKTVARFTPHAWANEAFAEILRRGGGITDVLPELGALAGFAIVLLTIAAWRMRKVITAHG